MSQSDLAKQIPSTTFMVYRIENGVSLPSVVRIMKIADILGVKCSALLDEEVAPLTREEKEAHQHKMRQRAGKARHRKHLERKQLNGENNGLG